jgi:hypothetical protein
MKLTDLRFYGNARDAIFCSGLGGAFAEVIEVLLATHVEVEANAEANHAEVIGRSIDDRFRARRGWAAWPGGGPGWTKQSGWHPGPAPFGLQMEMVSRRALVTQIARLCHGLESGSLRLGALIVPGADLKGRLPDTPSDFSTAIQILDDAFDGQSLPVVVLGVEHDVLRSAQPKQLSTQSLSRESRWCRMPWTDIERLRVDPANQAGIGAVHAKALLAHSARPCPGCGKHPHELSWLSLTSEPDGTRGHGGRDGWVVVCDSCKNQTDFFLTVMI